MQELRKQFESISDLRAEIKSLQSDNLKLYEKVRYTQSYRDTAIPGPSGSSGAGMLNGVMRREDDIGRYKDKYEESMNPFEAFKGRVSGYEYHLVAPADRAGSTKSNPSSESTRQGSLCANENDHWK